MCDRGRQTANKKAREETFTPESISDVITHMVDSGSLDMFVACKKLNNIAYKDYFK